ncbi:hypothetical protein GmHk_14G041030 [Glycine max]|nr:hypothetical protein GmHk_14G041030 [Glycine max]
MVNIFIPTEVWNMLVSRTYEFLDTHLQEKREMYKQIGVWCVKVPTGKIQQRIQLSTPGSLLNNKEKNKKKDCKNTSGEDVSFTSRISQSLTDSSQSLKPAPASSFGLYRSSHSKISQNSLELGPFSL